MSTSIDPSLEPSGRLDRRRVLGLLGGGAAAAALSGCRPEREDGRTVIRYMAWGNPEQLAVEQQICREFEERTPGIRVHLFMVPGTAYADKMQLMLASRTAPDVMRVDHYNFPALVRKDYFLPLNPFFEREDPGFPREFTPLAIEEGTYQGRLYGLNVLFGSVLIYYNRKLFAEAGIPEPYELNRQGRWNWQRFVDCAQALTKRDAQGRATQFGTNMVSSTNNPNFAMFASVIWNHGGDFMNSQMTHMAMDQDPGAVRGLEEYSGLRWKYEVAPTPADSALSAFTFESGKIAMHWGWAGESPRFRKAIKDFEWDITTTPSGPAGDRTVVKGNQICIHKETRHPREAWEFVKYMTGPQAEYRICGDLRRAVPTRLAVQESPKYLEATQAPYHTDVFLEAIRRGRTLPIDWRYQEWSQVFNSALEAIINVNEGPPQKVLADASQRVNLVLTGEEGF